MYMKHLCLLTFTSLLTMNMAFAASHTITKTPAVVVATNTSCAAVLHTKEPFILVLSKGDNILEKITQCAKEAKLTSAAISGLGQVQNPKLAYFTSNPNDKPIVTTFSGFYELAGLNGNITNNQNHYYTHAHVVLADKEFHGIAGHLDQAKVGLTAEITIVSLPTAAQRAVDEKTGFGPIVG